MSIEAMTFTLDPSNTPGRIELTPTAGGHSSGAPPVVSYGIYRVDGPSLLLCLALNGKPAPSSFDTEPGSAHRLFVLRRKKPVRAAVATPAAIPGMRASPAPEHPPVPAAPHPVPSPSARPAPSPSPSPFDVPPPATSTPSPASPAPAPRIESAPSATPGTIEGAPVPSPTGRVSQLLRDSERLRLVGDDRDRSWFLDQPSHLTPFRIRRDPEP